MPSAKACVISQDQTRMFERVFCPTVIGLVVFGITLLITGWHFYQHLGKEGNRWRIVSHTVMAVCCVAELINYSQVFVYNPQHFCWWLKYRFLFAGLANFAMTMQLVCLALAVRSWSTIVNIASESHKMVLWYKKFRIVHLCYAVVCIDFSLIMWLNVLMYLKETKTTDDQYDDDLVLAFRISRGFSVIASAVIVMALIAHGICIHSKLHTYELSAHQKKKVWRRLVCLLLCLGVSTLVRLGINLPLIMFRPYKFSYQYRYIPYSIHLIFGRTIPGSMLILCLVWFQRRCGTRKSLDDRDAPMIT